MKQRFVLMAVLLLVLSLSACGVLSEPEEASAPIEAIPLATQTTAVEAVAEETISEPAPEAAADQTSAGPVLFQIDPAASQVRFELDEDLRGVRTTVVGTTDQVAGELSIDLANLAAAQVGVLQINARTLATDNNFRNRAIQNDILETGSYEFITFTPTAVTGLPASANVGDTVEFTIEGDLTIRDITQPATFQVTATAVSATQLSGTATATVNRGDYELNIPNVPSVANVEEEVQLTIDFVANGS